MSDKTLYILEQGLWEASKVIGAFGSLEKAKARIEKFGKVIDENVHADETTIVFSVAKKPAEWFRVTAVEPCWE